MGEGKDHGGLREARRPTVHDVARRAGVSLATVDRVLNGRPGVRAETVEKVTGAIADLGFRRDLSASLLARGRDLQVHFILPDGQNEFMLDLAAAIARHTPLAAAERMRLSVSRIRALDAAALAARLDALRPESCDCAVVVATDAGVVREAVDAATRRGIAVMTLVSDLPGSARKAFIGIDNAAAGRTAGSLLGRFCPRGKIGVVAGSLALRDHRERFESFAGLLGREFPALEVLGPVEGVDDPERTAEATRALLGTHRDLAGLYNLGAGNAGLVRAVRESGRAGAVRVVAHELTAPTRDGLRTGAIDVVLDQNAAGEIRAALAVARALALGDAAAATVEPIEIGVYLRDNIR